MPLLFTTGTWQDLDVEETGKLQLQQIEVV
jgi:hypothetical protein